MSVVAALPLTVKPQSAVLLNRYSFDGPAGSTNITDSVGNANGTLINGSATATLTGSGQLTLDGNVSKAWVHLPGGLLNPLTNAIFETWVQDNDPNSDWAELWTFGTNNGTVGIHELTMVPNSAADGVIRLDDSQGLLLAPMPLTVSNEVCLTVRYDGAAQTASIYINGQNVASGTMTLQLYSVPDPDNYLGQSQYYGSGDPYFEGVLDEFRIYSGTESDLQIAIDAAAGPGNIGVTNPGTLNSIQFNTSEPPTPISTNVLLSGKFLPSVLANYSLLNNVNVSTASGITYSSDNTGVLAYETDGYFHAVDVGTTTIRASYQSQAAALTVTVYAPPAVLLHRYSFDGPVGSTNITDSVGNANGTLINGSATAGLNGNGQLVLDGNQSYAWVQLPSGIMPQLTNAIFETWVQNNDPYSDWAELWTFGTNNAIQGIHFLTLVPNNPVTGTIRLDNSSGLVLAPMPLPYTKDVCLTVSYNLTAQTASIYLNGEKVASGTVSLPLYTIPDPDNYLGQSQWYGSGDPYFNGVLDEFRIYSGIESDLQIAIDAAAGPNAFVTNPGTLNSLSVIVSTTNVDVHGMGVPVQVLANFANVSGVDVTALSQTTVSSSNPSVGTIVNGNFVPQNVGTSTLTATYNGVSGGSVVLNVVDTEAWPFLLHRWSFNEAPGSTTLTDSVGSINGTVYGPVTFTGQAMITPAGNPPPGADGLPTTNSGWASFPANQGLVTGLPNEASFEIWVVWNGGGVWQEMFDFGQAATPGYSLGGGQYVNIDPYDGANSKLRAEWDQNPVYDVTLLGPALQVGVLNQIVWTHDQDRQLDKLYLNGQLVTTAVNTALWSSLPDTDNWLARDEWQDPMFNGAYFDFRIWDGALTAGQVANLYKAGPNVIVGPSLNIVASGGNQITLQWPANATGFGLQSTTNLVGGAWVAVPGTPTVINGLNVLTVPESQGQTYYRLKQ